MEKSEVKEGGERGAEGEREDSSTERKKARERRKGKREEHLPHLRQLECSQWAEQRRW